VQPELSELLHVEMCEMYMWVEIWAVEVLLPCFRGLTGAKKYSVRKAGRTTLRGKRGVEGPHEEAQGPCTQAYLVRSMMRDSDPSGAQARVNVH
jgi:hypothetical protein